MKEKLKAMIRLTGKCTDIFPVAAILSVIMILAGQMFFPLLSLILPVGRLLELVTGSESVAWFLYDYLIFIGIWILFFLACGLVKWNRPIMKQLAPNRNGNSLKGMLYGLLLGFGANGFCVLMSVIMGDIHLYFNEFNPLIFFTFLLAVFIQSGAEEVSDRVYLYQKLRRRYKDPVVAILGNTVFFSALHLFNSGIKPVAVLCILASGLIFSLLVYYYDSVWAAIMMHTGWNFSQNIVFGLPNSGLVSEYSLFKLDAASAEEGLFYNVDFGVEGSVGAMLVFTFILFVIILLNRGKPEKNDVWGIAAAE